MKILVIGSGGRENALVWKLSQSSKVNSIFAAPGNGGTAKENKTVNVPIRADDINALLAFAKKEGVDLTVVGPEVPLSLGIVDLFENEGLKIFGPCGEAAKLEASKAFAKEIMIASGVPTASYKSFISYDAAAEWIKKKGAPLVVKADGLAAGKGVTVAHNIEDALTAIDEIFNKKIFGESGSTVVIEEFLEGEEVSYLVVTDGETVVPLVSSQDHKAVFDDDKGPNTGGMGAYSPAPVLNEEQYAKLSELVILPIIKELKKRGVKFKGVLYAGLMVSSKGAGKDLEGVKVLEYNARFGDPETQVILPRMKSDLFEMLMAASINSLHKVATEWYDKPCVTVVMASGGYPGDFKKGYEIKGIDEANKIDGVHVFHAGTEIKEGKIVTSGGRVLNVTAIGSNLQETIDTAYKGVDCISFKDAHYRKDIGAKATKKLI